MGVRWPPLAVRTWQGALNSRDPEYREFDLEHEVEAIESMRLHELRGLIVGQVAELESLLLHITSEIRVRYGGPLPVRSKRRGAGGAPSDLRGLLKTVFLGDELAEELETIGLSIRRRNWLVHGRIHVGLSQLGPYGALEPVISLLFENDEDDRPRSENDHEGEDEDIELGEFELTKYLNEAYVGLEAALDIWKKVDEALPVRHAEYTVDVDDESTAGSQN